MSHIGAHRGEENKPKAGNPTSNPAGVGGAARGVDPDTQEIRERLAAIERGLRLMADDVDKVLANINNKPYVKSIVPGIIDRVVQLLVECGLLEKPISRKMYKILWYRTNGAVDSIVDWESSPVVRKIIREIKGGEIIGKLYVIRDGLKIIAGFLSGALDYLDKNDVDAAKTLVINVKRGFEILLERLDQLRGLLEGMTIYDDKLSRLW